MGDARREPTPEEPTAALAAAALRFSRHVPAPARRFFSIFALGISPTVPYVLSDGVRDLNVGRIVTGALLVAYTLGLGAILAWTGAQGTLWPQDDGILQFGQDVSNILNYVFIVPAYVALGTLLILIVLRGENDIRATTLVATRARFWWFRIVCAAFAVFASAYATANYFAEILDPTVYPDHYWFIEGVSADGTRLLGALGVYFAILNFSLLVLTITAIIAFIIAAARMYELGFAFRNGRSFDASNRDELRDRLRYFTAAYIVGKLLAAVYMLNLYTWRMQAPEGSLNLTVAAVAVTIIGVFFVASPRYWVELQWHWYGPAWARERYQDIRPSWMQWTAHALDTLIIGGFITSFWLR